MNIGHEWKGGPTTTRSLGSHESLLTMVINHPTGMILQVDFFGGEKSPYGNPCILIILDHL